MARSNNTFPTYVKLDIHEDDWPDMYWDRSQRCNTCEISWPWSHLFNPCLNCGNTCVAQNGPPDMRWPEAVHRLKTHRFEKFYDEWNEGKEDEDLEWEEVRGEDGELDDSKVSAAVDAFMDSSQQTSVEF